MKKLPQIFGLLREAEMHRRSATILARRAQAPNTCPRDAYEAGIDADKEARIAGELEAMASDDADLVTQIESCIECLAGAKPQTPRRTLAMRALEQASAHLRREVGDPPTA